MASQWYGVKFTPESHGSELSHTVIRNTVAGVAVDSITEGVALKMVNCRLRNSAGYAFESRHSRVEAYGCEFADASLGVVSLTGGDLTFNHCTFANYYLFTALRGPAVQLWHIDGENDDESGLPYMKADFSNCIIYGNGTDMSHGDLTGTGVFIVNTLLKSKGDDDDNFIRCIWDKDPLYYTVREDYVFDYRLRDDSSAAMAGDPSLMRPEARVDFYGVRRDPAAPSLGAYQYVPSATE